VRRLRSITALLLLGLWLPVTQHCGLEAAEWLLDNCDHAGEAAQHASDKACTADGCDVVESGVYYSDAAAAKVPAPALHTGSCLLCLRMSEPQPAATPAWTRASDRPPGWMPGRHFARRAALPARAPDCAV
jgi:hypothetical protein